MKAYIYGFPVVTNYRTMYKQAIDTSSPDYRAPLNVLTSSQTWPLRRQGNRTGCPRPMARSTLSCGFTCQGLRS
jgi:hypothetical protein